MPTMLVVDDDRTLTSLLEYKFTRLGYTVRIEPDGALALDALRQTTFDVLVLDIMMPRIDGFQVLREIHDGSLQRPNITIILSARGDERDVLLAFDLGAIDYVTKPFSLSVLAARIAIGLRYKQPILTEN
jgi:DNA-binding response OmpR family regulator